MIGCPAPEELRELLDGDPDPERASAIRDHLKGCDSCVAALARLSDDPALDSWMADAGPEGPEAARRLVRDSVRGEVPDRPHAIGMFEIEAEVGRGGMGVVYRARDTAIGRVVALKALRLELVDERSRRRFVQEVRAAARVEHDHVVRVYGTSDPAYPRPYLVMEFVAGPSLADRIRDRGRLDPREAADLVAQAAAGLAAAHDAGLVHRDVKPANVLIDAATGRAKIGDFGLARLASESGELTREGVVAGTPAYLSPEQARGEPGVGPLSDVYALGVTLYECLAGEPPFRGTPHRIVQQILHDEPRPPRVLNDLVPRDLQTICLKAMDKDPSRRYAGASELAEDLRRWRDGVPIRARPIGRAGRLWKLIRRHPRVAALSASLVVALAAGVAGILWQWRRAEANGRQARDYLARALGAIDAYLTRVSENRLLDVPSLQPLRKELLAAATESYEGLLRDRPRDPRIRVELAKARARLAGVASLVGSYDEVIPLLRRSLDEFDEILADSPGDFDARDGRIIGLAQLAAVELRAAKLDECRSTAERLVALCEAERRTRPGSEAPLEGLYAAHHDLGRVASLRGEPPQSVAAEFERAMAANRGLLALRPDHAPYLRNTSRSAAMLGDSYHAIGRVAEGWAANEEGYRAARRLVAEHPESLDYRFSLAPYEAIRGNRALRESLSLKGASAMAKLDDARRNLAAALDLVRGLVRENPEVDIYRGDLLGHLASASAVELASGRPDALHAIVDEAREVYAGIRHAENPYGYTKTMMAGLLLQDAYALAQDGRADEALSRLDDADAAVRALTDRDRATQKDLAFLTAALACGRASVLGEAGRPSESSAQWGRAIACTPPALRPLVEIASALGSGVAGPAKEVDPRKALAAAPSATALSVAAPLPAFTYGAYARLHALAASAVGAQDSDPLDAQAVFCLEKAAQAGYFRDRSRLERIESDPILARLKGRADYAEFLDRARSR